MRRLGIGVIALLAALTLTSAADACSATNVLNRGVDARDTEIYDVVRDVVVETLVPRWRIEKEWSIESMIGSMLYDHEYSGSYGGHPEDFDLTVHQDVRDFLNEQGAGHGGAFTVTQHAVYHALQYENYEDAPDWWEPDTNVTPEPPVEPRVDHAG
jgi:hypothetical protein